MSEVKIYDSSKQSGPNICQTKECPGILLATPEGCVCSCGNGDTLNASGTKCLPQLNKKTCGYGK